MTVADVLPNAELIGAGNNSETSIGLGGLRAIDGRAFPLVKVTVRASLAGPCAHTVIEQHFANPFDETLDVTWIFPLPDTGAIVELELRAGDIRVVGECLERAAAQATFDAARREGKRTALVEKEQGSVHTLSLAGLPARSDVIVKLTLVELLPSVDNRFRWQFPTTIAPRYTPGTPIGHGGFGVAPDTDLVANASRLSPPLRLAGGTQLDLEVEIAGPVSALESSLHAVKLTLDSGAVRVALSARATLNKDFILEFSTADMAAPTTRAWTDGAHTLVLLEPPSNSSVSGIPRDAVFAVDISGSMGGEKLQAAKTALLGALHGLRTGDRFKLIAFDDRVECFARDFATYNDHNLAAAHSWVEKLEARGGTEMLEAIQESLAGTTVEGRLRTVLFITDGQSSDEARLLPAVANRKGNAVFFTLGIDTAVNAALLKALAVAGGGACELCTPYDDIDAIVARLETRFGTPLLSQITVAGSARPDGHVVFSGRPAMLLLGSAPSTVEIRGVSATGPFVTNVTPTPIAFPLGTLWAKERVSWLEERLVLKPFEEEAIRPEVLRIALQWHIASRFTSFVCVDHSAYTTGARHHVVQPTELPDSWETQELSMDTSAYGAMGGAQPVLFSAMMPSPSAFSPSPLPLERLLESESESPFSDGTNDDDALAGSQSDIPMQETQSPGSYARSGFSIRETFRDIFASKQADASPAKSESLLASGTPKMDAGTIARTQSADGSFGGDVGRTAAALLVLVLLGHTRNKGDRRRTVQKAAEWLRAHSGDMRAAFALGVLDDAETSRSAATAQWRSLANESSEGRMLVELLALQGV